MWCVHSAAACFWDQIICNAVSTHGPRKEKRVTAVVRMLKDFKNRKKRGTNCGEGCNVAGLGRGHGKPSGKAPFDVL